MYSNTDRSTVNTDIKLAVSILYRDCAQCVNLVNALTQQIVAHLR